MTLRSLRITLYVLAITLVYAAPTIALATGFVPISNSNTTGGVDNFTKLFKTSDGKAGDLSTFVSSAFRITLSIGAILAVMRIAWAGYQYMTSDAWGEKSHAKEILGDVFIGLLLLLSVYLILKQINPDILSLKAIQLEK